MTSGAEILAVAFCFTVIFSSDRMDDGDGAGDGAVFPNLNAMMSA